MLRQDTSASGGGIRLHGRRAGASDDGGKAAPVGADAKVKMMLRRLSESNAIYLYENGSRNPVVSAPGILFTG